MNATVARERGQVVRGLLLQLGGLVLATVLAVGLQASERASANRDAYPYAQIDGPGEQCGFDYIELGASASTLRLVPGHPGAADDDLAAVLPLARPFELYQQRVDTLVVSGNGYLAAAEGFDQDDGSDYSNDCNLPAAADNPRASQNRIYAYHDDLRPRPGARVRQAHFPVCPRAPEAGGEEGCTVVEWDGFEHAGPLPSSQPLRVQAVIYHDSHQVALQYHSVDDSRAAQATIGLQGFDGRTARRASCNLRDRVAGGQSLCFLDPRHAPGARLAQAP